MKKIAVVWSTPNTDGLTAAAKDRFTKGAAEAGAAVEEVHLNRKKIEHCIACANGWGTCRNAGTCVLDDDFASVYSILKAADGIVWVTAVYWSDTTECFKALFDRVRRCDAFCNRSLAGKHSVIIACAGGSGNGTLECMMQIERGLKHMGMNVCDRIPVERYNRQYMLPAIEEAGKTFAGMLEKASDSE